MKTAFFFFSIFVLISCQSNENVAEDLGQSQVNVATSNQEINPAAVLLNDSAVSIMAINGRGAIEVLNKAIAIHPNYFSAWHNKVNCQMHLGLIDDAIVSLLKMEEIDPHYPDSKTNLGILYDLTGQNELASKKYQEVETMYVGILDTIQSKNNPYQMYELLHASNMKLMGKEDQANTYLKKLLSNPAIDTIYTSKAVKDLLGVDRNMMLDGFRENLGGL